MKDLICEAFQSLVEDSLIRHYSLLDILSKLNSSSCRVSCRITKSVTECGCISIQAKKNGFPPDSQSVQELKTYLDNHIRGKLCPDCEELLNDELGQLLFYFSALCNAFDMNMYDIFIREYKKTSTLGIFNMT